MLFVAAVVGVVLALPGVSGAQAPPAQDSVVLTGGPAQAASFTVIAVSAASGPSGENPTGQIRFDVFGNQVQLGGPVTCLAVSGNTATINFRQPTGPFAGINTVEVVDNQPDTFTAAPTFREPTDCSPLDPIFARYSLSGGNITVVDAPPLPTSRGQCKEGGWQQFGFKNQGQCVASLNR